MRLIGLTGGIGAGKSTIATRLASHGAHIVDADQMARRAVGLGTQALTDIVARFGEGVILASGELNRPALGAIVFKDDRARLDLESIVHPAVHEMTSSAFAQIEREHPDAIVVYDVPLLVEAKNRYPFDLVVVAHAPASIRIQRLVELRGMPLDQAQSRVSSQATDDERLAVADVVIDTSGTIEHTNEQVDELWKSLQSSQP